jgi:AcrR family transcriptional regulator
MNRPSVRERLFKTALQAFAEHGYAEVSVDEIVRAAKTTKPMLYYYFGNKSGLYQAIAEESFGMLRAGYERAADPSIDPLERLRAFVLADFRTMRDNPHLARFIYRTAYSAPRDAPAIDYWKLFLPSFQMVTGIVEAGQATGLIGPGPAPMLALPLFGLASIWSQVHLGADGFGGSMLDDAQAEAVVQYYLHGVGRR